MVNLWGGLASLGWSNDGLIDSANFRLGFDRLKSSSPKPGAPTSAKNSPRRLLKARVFHGAMDRLRSRRRHRRLHLVALSLSTAPIAEEPTVSPSKGVSSVPGTDPATWIIPSGKNGHRRHHCSGQRTPTQGRSLTITKLERRTTPLHPRSTGGKGPARGGLSQGRHPTAPATPMRATGVGKSKRLTRHVTTPASSHSPCGSSPRPVPSRHNLPHAPFSASQWPTFWDGTVARSH